MTSDVEIEEKWRLWTRRRSRFHLAPLAVRLGHQALRRMLEAAKGSLRGVIDTDGSRVVVDDRLRRDALAELTRGRDVCAIHVRRFCSPEIAERLSAVALTEYTNWKVKGNVPTDMFYAGGSVPHSVAVQKRSEFFRYVGEWEQFVAGQRAAAGGAWPVDTLRLRIDEAWPGGAHLGQAMPGVRSRPAVMRVMLPDASEAPERGYVHTDDSPFINPRHGILSANIYLRIPPAGGELNVWNVNFSRVRTARERLRNWHIALMVADAYTDDVQRKLQAALPRPLTIRPESGDLVILHTGRFHSVVPVRDGLRVTNQTFVHYRGNRPLAIES